MLIPRQNKPLDSFRSPSLMGAVCRTRTELLDRLAGAVERLGRAKLSLETDTAEPMHEEVEWLRLECSAIRRELESHRVGHGC